MTVGITIGVAPNNYVEFDADEFNRQNQIRYEDSFYPNDQRQCSGCEVVQKSEIMTDFIQDGFTFKVCKECAPYLLSWD